MMTHNEPVHRAPPGEGRRRQGAVSAAAIAIILLVSTWSIACGDEDLTWATVNSAVRAKYGSVEHLSTSELARWIQTDSVPVPVLIDSREPEEFDVSHLRGAVVAPDLRAALEAISALGKDHPIVVYCSVGYRSGALAQGLQEKGWTNVFNLEGSIFKWANEGRPVFDGDTRVFRVHPYNHTWGTLLDKRLWPEGF